MAKSLYSEHVSGSERSNAKFVWKQSPDGRWIETDKVQQTKNTKDMPKNLFKSPADSEAPRTMLCGICCTAMHFQKCSNPIDCSICEQTCGNIQLVCDNCGLFICCDRRRYYTRSVPPSWLPSCYSSYFDPLELVRGRVYNTQGMVSEFDTDDQQRWLQCMWHDIDRNMNRLRVELRRVLLMDTTCATTVKLISEILGQNLTKGLVRLFIIYQSKFDTDLVEWFSNLIQHGRDLFSKVMFNPSLGSVALKSVASLNGRLGQLKWLIFELELDITKCKAYGGLVGLAAKLGRLQVVDFFLQENLLEYGYDTALIQASFYGHLNVVERLLQDNRVDPSASLNLPINVASGEGHIKVVERLLQDKRVDPSTDDNFAIRMASEYGHSNVVERLLQDNRVDPSAKDNYAIRMASEHGHSIIVNRLFQDKRVDPSADDNYAIRMASEHGHSNVVNRLLQDNRVDPSADDNYAIIAASWEGHVKVVEQLLQDDRVDPAAQECKAVRVARNGKVLICLYKRTSNTVCYMADETFLLEQVACLHQESLIMGGFCLSNVEYVKQKLPVILPNDCIWTILSRWATLHHVAVN